jgi:hypothetical protein
MTKFSKKIGDVFSVEVSANTRKYFQYIANDLTQLNSQVIRAFKKSHPSHQSVDLETIVREEVEFFAHVFLNVGVKLGYWQKVGNVQEVGALDVLFRDTNDYGDPSIKLSEKWFVWKTNEPFIRVGKLEGNNRDAEIGVVLSPDIIVSRMKTGEYDFVYPKC